MAFNNEGTAPTAEETFGWNDEIVDDGNPFEQKPTIVLPEGDYEFTVIKLTKGSQRPTDKIPTGCNRAELLLKISTPNGDSLINENLLLIKKMEWKISAFFRCIGQKKHGEPLRMNWNAVYNESTKKGATGKAHFKVEEYQRNDGTTGTKNVVDKYYDAEPWN